MTVHIPWESPETPARGGFVGRAWDALREQPERLILLNLAWALNLFPLVLVWLWSDMPTPLRVLMLAWGLLALPPATVAVYACAQDALEGIELRIQTVLEHVGRLWKPSLSALTPLLLLWLACSSLVRGFALPLPLDILFKLLTLLLSWSGLYWAALLVRTPSLSVAKLLRRSLSGALEHFFQTLALFVVCAAVLVFSVMSIAGLALVGFVAIALLQTSQSEKLNPFRKPDSFHRNKPS
jgi:hypothetical protein